MWFAAASRSVARAPAVEPAPAPSTMWERLALFTLALGKQRAPELFEGLSMAVRGPVLEAARSMAEWSSSERQARLALEFGSPSDAAARLRTAMAQVGPAVRAEMARLLPAYHRALVGDLVPAGATAGSGPPVVIALAERLVREAIR